MSSNHIPNLDVQLLKSRNQPVSVLVLEVSTKRRYLFSEIRGTRTDLISRSSWNLSWNYEIV